MPNKRGLALLRDLKSVKYLRPAIAGILGVAALVALAIANPGPKNDTVVGPASEQNERQKGVLPGVAGVTESPGSSGVNKATQGQTSRNQTGTRRIGGVLVETYPGSEGTQGLVINGKGQKVMRLGFLVEDRASANANFDAVGLSIDVGDNELEARALIDDLNRRGGIHGRFIEPYFLSLNTASSVAPGDDETSTCRQMTEDAKVFAVITHFLDHVGARCYADKKTLVVRTGNLIGDDAEVAATSPWVWTPSGKSESRVWRTMIPTLEQEGFFEGIIGDPVVGLVYEDTPAFKRTVDQVVKPRLAQLDKHDIVIREHSYPSGDESALQVQMEAAVVKFKSTGVDRVMFIPGFVNQIMFMGAAHGQEFRPAYAIQSSMIPFFQLESTPITDIQLSTKSIGIGWRPKDDVSPSVYPDGGGRFTPAEEKCRKILEAGGVNIQTRSNPLLAFDLCESFSAFEAAAKAAGPDLKNNTWVAGLKSLGASYDSVVGFNADFTKGTTDGSYKHRILYWDPPTRHFRYRGGLLDDK